MKKWMYLIAPCIMLGLFVIVYLSHEKGRVEAERVRNETVAKNVAAEKKKKDEAETRAREDAAKKQAEREEEEKKKETERRLKREADDKKIRDEIAAAVAEAKDAEGKANALQAELDRLQKERDRAGRDAFDAAKAVEAAKVDRRNAELESQRMVEQISRRASDSSLVRMPQPVALPQPPPAR